MWRRCIAYANDPERLFARFRHQCDVTYVNRIVTPARGKLSFGNLSSALVLAFRLALHIGILSDYRKPFWRAARHALRRGQIDAVLGMGFIAHHLIEFTREALRGEQNASYYSTKARQPEPARRGNWRRCANRRNRRHPHARSVGKAQACPPSFLEHRIPSRLCRRARARTRCALPPRVRPRCAHDVTPASARAWSTTARDPRRP